MKYIVPIDRKTIKVNDNVGDTSTVVHTTLYMSFDSTVPLPADFVEGVNYVWTSWSQGSDEEYRIKGEIIKDHEKLWSKHGRNRNLGLSRSAEHKYVYHAPIPMYSYEYQNIDIECSECGHKMKVEDLEADINNDDTAYNTRICPHCGEWDCCSLEYEELSEDKIINISKK